MKKNRNIAFYIGLFSTLVGFCFSTFFCFAAYIKYVEDDSGAFGTIGLRSYFHCGTGTEEDPFVITRPKHLFNLSRLQSLGVFSEQKYFQLGYDLDDSGDKKVYTGDTGDKLTDVLDMKDYDGTDNQKTLADIGNESTPFYGIFEGNGLEIKNAQVHCSLEDSGLFGYVSSRAEVRNLILDDITIQNDGYSSGFASLYSEDAGKTLKHNTGFEITQGSRKVKYTYDENGKSQIEDSKSEAHNSTNTLSFEIKTDLNASEEDTYKMPSFSLINKTDSKQFTYSLLPSEGFFTSSSASGTEVHTLTEKKDGATALDDIFSYFDSYNDKENAVFPLKLSMTMSLVANYLDSSGINHAKVVSALNLSFEKLSKKSNFITMYTQPRETEHGNNMGLVVGHLDGSLKNVYVHDGTFKMNTISKNTPVDQKSMIGFVGYVGPSVEDNATNQSKGNIASSGKDVGVLDFTEIYESVVGSSEFTQKTSGSTPYYEYTPVSDNEYMDYLRYINTGDSYRISNDKNTISLIGQKLIQDDDSHNRGLGVFTIATDYRQGGTGSEAFLNYDSSTIVKSKIIGTGTSAQTPKFDSENIFFSTYEYQKDNPYYKFDDVKNTLNNYATSSSTSFLPGEHIPLNVTSSSQSLYEAFYNYLFRFKLDDTRDDFYFSDLNSSSIGGNFLNSYLNYKLIDDTGTPIEPGSSQFGIMVKDKKRKNISQLTTNFYLNGSGPMYINNPTQDDFSISNSINFEIKTENANVTILAGSKTNIDSMLGIYKIPTGQTNMMQPQGETAYVPTRYGKEMKWSDPDYGMVLRKTSQISFFEYNNGKIGSADLRSSYFNDNEEVTSNNNTSKRLNKDGTDDFDSSFSDYIGYPIYAHTFKLPKGRYCLGSAIGDVCVYYICAQGQDNGDLSLSANAFSQINKIENVDFLTTAIQDSGSPFFSISNNKVSANQDNINAKRCYLIFDSGNISHFKENSNNNTHEFILKMNYDEKNEQFIFAIDSGSYTSSIDRLALTSYKQRRQETGSKNTTINLFGQIRNDSSIIYRT